MTLKFFICFLLILNLSAISSASIVVDTYSIYNNFYLCWKYTGSGWISENQSMATSFLYNSTNPLSNITLTCFKGENTTTDLLVEIYSSGMIHQRNYSDYLLCSSRINWTSTNLQDVLANFTNCNLQANQSYLLHLTSPGAPYEYDKIYACGYMYTCTNLYPYGQYYQLFSTNQTGWCFGNGDKCWSWSAIDSRDDMLFKIEDKEPANYYFPDIKVSSLNISNSTPSENANLSITALIENIGSIDAKNVTIKFILDENLGFWNETINLPKNTTYTIAINWTAIFGVHNITVVADPENMINESNETNNNATVQINVAGLSDLQVTGVSFYPENPIENQNLTINATIMNIGNSDAVNFTILFSIGNLTIFNSTANLSRNSSLALSANWTAEYGNHILSIAVDPENQIQEINEENNNASRQINISPYYCRLATWVNGTIKRDLDPLKNIKIQITIGNDFAGENLTDLNGNYRIFLNLSSYSATETLNATLVSLDIPYIKGFTITCGETKTLDVILSNLGEQEKPVLYTTTKDGKIERVFKSGDKVYITVVLKNPSAGKVSERLEVSITDENGNEIDKIVDKNINLKPNEIRAVKEQWKSRDFAKQNLSGFEFTGKKFFVKAEFGSITQNYGFYVDEFGVPEWLRRNVELHLGDEFRDIINNAKDKEEVLEYYRNRTQMAKDAGFTSILFHHYYTYGYCESHQPYCLGSTPKIKEMGVNYWFPAGASPDTHYSTPYPKLVKLVGSEEEAQNLIKQLVDIAHSKGLKVIAYIDPMAIYNPGYDPILNTPIYTLDYANQILTGYPAAVAHHDSESLGYVFMDENLQLQRANFIETYLNWNAKDCTYMVLPITNVNKFAYKIISSGPGRYGLANNEYAFSPEVVWSDFNPWTSDPSHHYQTVRQVNWLIRNYDFDGISTDDTGRLIMAFGPAPYQDDFWTCAMQPKKPSQSLYGISEDNYTRELRGDQDKDYFAMDSLANMIKHIRWQIKDYSSDKILISNDYFVPRDVDWDSILSSEDMSASDQFTITKPSFARWAYLTYDEGYKTLRNDMRRTLAKVPFISISPIDDKADKERPDMVRGVLLAMGWANRVHTEIILDELKRAERLLKNYVDMRRTVKLPIYNETLQELLYHSNLEKPDGFQSNPELEQTGNEGSYAVLYRIPSEYGEKSRILHVINSRAATEGIDNDKVSMDYSFRIRIPSLEEVSGVYLVSADFNTTKYPDYTWNITTLTPDIWYTQSDYLYLKIPQVITSTTTYIEFKPKNLTGKSYGSRSIIDKNGKVQKLQQLSLKPVKQNKTENISLQVSPEANSISLSLSWGGSDLDLNLYSPSGQHYGYNYTTNTTDGNAAYTITNISESISVQNPESGNWTVQIYGRNVSQQYNETGEPYSLGISTVGDYKPNLTAGISAKTVTLNESASLPVSIRNSGSAIAYNLSAIFYSDSFNIIENISLQNLEAGIGLNTEIMALPLALGNATVYLNLSYSDAEGNQYTFSNQTVMQIVANPRLYIYLDYSPVNPTTGDILRFNISLLNIGSSTAYRINLTTQLDSGISAITSANLTLTNLSSGQSADFSFNAIAQAGRFYTRSYAYYESQNRTLFLAGSNEAEIRVSETTTTTLPSPPTTLPPTPPEQPPVTTTTTTLLTTTSTTTTITQTTTTITQPITTSTTTTSTITTSTTTSSTTTSLTTTTQTTTTSSSTTTLLGTITTTTSTITPTTTLPDIIPPEILKSVSKVDGRKAILKLLTDGISVCKYDAEDKTYEGMENIFTETNSTVHNEILKLQKGSYTYYARCIDRFGNVDNYSTIFNLTINVTTPEWVTTQLPVSNEIILCKNDGVKNYAEEGVDCGGLCKPCETTTTVRTTTTTVKITTTTLAITSTVTTSITTTTLPKVPDIVGRVTMLSGKRNSEIVLFALIFTVTVMLIYYLKGGKKE